MESFKKMTKMKTDVPCYANGGTVKRTVGASMMPLPKERMERSTEMKATKPTMSRMPKRARASMSGMPALAMPNAMPTGMKKGGYAKGGKLQKEIRNESEEIGRVKARLTKHEDMAASKAHKGLKSGGRACYAEGGAIKKEYVNTKVVEAKKHTKAGATGGVKGYKTGGVAEPGFKRGGRCAK